MGIDDLIGKAKDALEGNEDKVARTALDKAADSSRTAPTTPSTRRSTMAVDKAKDFLEDEKD